MPITVRLSLRLAASMFALLTALVLSTSHGAPLPPRTHAFVRVSCDIFRIDQTGPIAFSAHKELFGHLLAALALGDVGTPMHWTGLSGVSGPSGPGLCTFVDLNCVEFSTHELLRAPCNVVGRHGRMWPWMPTRWT